MVVPGEALVLRYVTAADLCSDKQFSVRQEDLTPKQVIFLAGYKVYRQSSSKKNVKQLATKHVNTLRLLLCHLAPDC